MSDPIRLDKHVAAVFGCSRGEAQQYIEGGWVSVDGVVVEEPQAPITGQQVSLAADAVLGQAEPATLLLNKPAGMSCEAAVALATSQSRSSLDQTEIRVLKRHFLRLSAPMPLDDEASGLLCSARMAGSCAGSLPMRPRSSRSIWWKCAANCARTAWRGWQAAWCISNGACRPAR